MTIATNERDLSIVIPVYNALEETLDCVSSLLESDAKDCAVYIMDDGSDWAVQEQLRATFKHAPNVQLISHFRNRGYTRNISMGIEQTTTPFVCILNSDTLLPNVWAGPMLERMRSDSHLAGIGPLSNAASYQSVPDVVDPITGVFSENDGLGFNPEERSMVADLVRHIGQGKCVDAPILNGFCTIFRRNALDAIGGFDIESYPHGYGEENDLCVRLKAEGYRLAILLGVFVHHQKSKSFGSSRKKSLSAKGSQMLAQKFGPSLVPKLDKQLKQSTPLEAMRRLVKIALDSGHGSIAPLVTLTASSSFVTVGPGAGRRCILLSGGGTYRISTDRIEPSIGDGGSCIRLASTIGDLTVRLPDGFNLTVFSASPISSALHGLSLLSIEQTVYVDAWQVGERGANSLMEWPESWNMGHADEVPFSHLSLRI